MLHLKRRGLFKMIGYAVVITQISWTSSALASRSSDQQNFQRLEQALGYFAEASLAARQRNMYKAEGELRKGYYRLKIAKLSMDSQRNYQNRAIIEALSVALEKVQDRYLSPIERATWGLDCLHVGMTKLIDRSMHGRRAARAHVKISRKMVRACAFELAAQSLHSAARCLGYGSRESVNALKLAAEKITDPYLSVREKIEWYRDCVRVAMRAM